MPHGGRSFIVRHFQHRIGRESTKGRGAFAPSRRASGVVRPIAGCASAHGADTPGGALTALGSVEAGEADQRGAPDAASPGGDVGESRRRCGAGEADQRVCDAPRGAVGALEASLCKGGRTSPIAARSSRPLSCRLDCSIRNCHSRIGAVLCSRVAGRSKRGGSGSPVLDRVSIQLRRRDRRIA
jgi:hypothetical protein